MSQSLSHLYKITLGGRLGIVFVVANDPNEAITMVEKDLNSRDYGLRKDRQWQSIELVAQDSNYPEGNAVRLYTKK